MIGMAVPRGEDKPCKANEKQSATPFSSTQMATALRRRTPSRRRGLRAEAPSWAKGHAEQRRAYRAERRRHTRRHPALCGLPRRTKSLPPESAERACSGAPTCATVATTRLVGALFGRVCWRHPSTAVGAALETPRKRYSCVARASPHGPLVCSPSRSSTSSSAGDSPRLPGVARAVPRGAANEARHRTIRRRETPQPVALGDINFLEQRAFPDSAKVLNGTVRRTNNA